MKHTKIKYIEPDGTELVYLTSGRPDAAFSMPDGSAVKVGQFDDLAVVEIKAAPQMTDDEALAALRDGSGYIDWVNEKHRPHWTPEDEPTIRLSGAFTADELLAILHFAQRS